MDETDLANLENQSRGRLSVVDKFRDHLNAKGANSIAELLGGKSAEGFSPDDIKLFENRVFWVELGDVLAYNGQTIPPDPLTNSAVAERDMQTMLETYASAVTMMNLELVPQKAKGPAAPQFPTPSFSEVRANLALSDQAKLAQVNRRAAPLVAYYTGFRPSPSSTPLPSSSIPVKT